MERIRLSVSVKSVLDRLCKAPAAPEKDIVHLDGLYQASSATEKKLEDKKAFEEEVLLNGPCEDASAADIESDKKALVNDHEAPQSVPEDQHVLLHRLTKISSSTEKEENEGYKVACVNDPEAPRSAPEDQRVLLHGLSEISSPAEKEAENEGYKKACVNDPEAPRSAPEDHHVLLHGLSEISSPAEKEAENEGYKKACVNDPEAPRSAPEDQHVLLHGLSEISSPAEKEAEKEGGKKAFVNDSDAPRSAPEDQHVRHGLRGISSAAEKECGKKSHFDDLCDATEIEGEKKAFVKYDGEAPSTTEDQHILFNDLCEISSAAEKESDKKSLVDGLCDASENNGNKKSFVKYDSKAPSAPEDHNALCEIYSAPEKEGGNKSLVDGLCNAAEIEGDKPPFVKYIGEAPSALEDQHVVLKSSSAAEKEGDEKCHVDGHGEASSAPKKDVLTGTLCEAWSAAIEAFLIRLYRAFSVDKKTLVNGLSKAFSAAVDTFSRSLLHALFIPGKTLGQRLSVALSQAKVKFRVNLVRDLSKCSNSFVVCFCEALFAALEILLPTLVELLLKALPHVHAVGKSLFHDLYQVFIAILGIIFPIRI